MNRSFLARSIGALVLIASMMSFIPQPAQAAELDGDQVFNKALKSTVWIVVQLNDGLATGSGSLIDIEKRLVLTNHHVIMGNDKCLVQFPSFDKKGELISEKSKYFDAIKSNGAIPGKVLFSEKNKDLAIVQLDKSVKLPKYAQPIRMAEKAPARGSKVHSIGNPGASDSLFVYTPGEVRASYIKKWTAGGGGINLEIEAKIIESTSPTSPGDSGGPLLNGYGELVGVTQGGKVDPKAALFSYFIDLSEVKDMLQRHKITIATVKGTDMPKTEDDVKPAVEPDPKVIAKKDPKKEVNPAIADEKAAETTLARIKTLIDQGKKDLATTRLEELISKYPNTDSAKIAKDWLKKLK